MRTRRPRFHTHHPPFQSEWLEAFSVYVWNVDVFRWYFRTRCTPRWEAGGVIVGTFESKDAAIEYYLEHEGSLERIAERQIELAGGAEAFA